MTVAVKVLVEATPISGPAWMYRIPCASRARALPTTLQTATTAAPLALAACTAPSVSAVSPDWESATTRVSGPTSGSRYRNSEAMSTSAGTPASRSRYWRPTRAAWYEVPQATRTTRANPRSSSVVRLRSGRKQSPVSGEIRPRKVSVMARGCS